MFTKNTGMKITGQLMGERCHRVVTSLQNNYLLVCASHLGCCPWSEFGECVIVAVMHVARLLDTEEIHRQTVFSYTIEDIALTFKVSRG